MYNKSQPHESALNSPSEHAFDAAIARRDLDRAHDIALQVLHQDPEKGYSKASFHTSMKWLWLAMPLYERSMGHEDKNELKRVYGEMTKFMDGMVHYHDHIARHADDNLSAKYVRGDINELTFLSLIASKIYGNPGDAFNIVPASRKEDQSGMDMHGFRTGIDFWLHDRHQATHIPVQIKATYQEAEQEQYKDDILVISMESISGDGERMRLLQQAMVHQAEGISNKVENKRINRAYTRVVQHVHAHEAKTASDRAERHIHDLGSQGTRACMAPERETAS